jgi:hypothetical protein
MGKEKEEKNWKTLRCFGNKIIKIGYKNSLDFSSYVSMPRQFLKNFFILRLCYTLTTPDVWRVG